MEQHHENKYAHIDISTLKGNPEDRFVPPKKWNDVWAAILFVAHFLLLAGIAIGGFVVGIIEHASGDDTTPSPPPTNYNYNEVEFNPYITEGIPFTYIITITISVVLCGLVGGAFGCLWLWLMRKFPKQMILSGIIFSAVFVSIAAVITIVLGVLFFNIILMALGGLMLLLNFVFIALFFCWRKRLEFSAQLLTAIVSILNNFKGTFLVSAVGIAAYSIWFFFWILFLLAIQQYVYVSPYVAGVFMIFALFSWFWTCQVIKNVVHTTITGTVGMWYFRDEVPDEVVKGSLIRACTTSFGSICFGSLLVALITTVRVLAESMARSKNNNIFLRLVCCFVANMLRVFEDLLNYFNRYAYTFISIYGEPYIPSAKRAFKLFCYFGFDAVMNDSLIGSVIGMGCFLGAILSAIIALGVSFFFELISIADSTAVGISFILGFLTGYGVIIICLEPVNCAVVGLFVSVCEEPYRLQQKIPALWDALHVRYATHCSNLFSHV